MMVTLQNIVKRVSYNTSINTVELMRVMSEIFKNVRYELVEGNDVEIKNFGTLRTVTVRERGVTDRDTGMTSTVPEHRAVRLFPVKDLDFITDVDE